MDVFLAEILSLTAALFFFQTCASCDNVRMATNGGSPRGPSPLLSKPTRPSFGKRRDKDENVAKAAGLVVAGGIVWSLFKSVTGRGKPRVHTHEHTRTVTIVNFPFNIVACMCQL